ncbi:MAG: hypothetical protein OSJ60_04010 [Lachnospiraceae bacterium]|nr:hypothetical protein [Lachnospiraceae bacterium]
MRMTNKIMQNNSLYNINNNKVLQDKLSTMMSTQKKITRPSDDPVIAIRALRLRTNVTELTQFYEKNSPDAESWLNVTEGALNTTTKVLTEMIRLANKGANKDLGSKDLDIIIGQMKSLRDEFYSTGNVDYAGRYVFTGYRTDTTLSFTEEIEEQQKEGYPVYKITEQKTIAAFDTINHTNIGNLDGLNKDNYTDTKYDNIKEQDISNGNIHRLRLSYDGLKGEIKQPPVNTDVEIKFAKDATTVTADTVSVTDNPYDQILAANAANTDKVIFIPETGELLFSDKAYENMEAKVKALDGTDTELQITYTKDKWQKGDLRPEHYFACESTVKDEAGNDKTIKYNEEYLTGQGAKQTIEYDVGYNQKIQVNTTADEVFTHGMDRDIDDLEKALAELSEIDATKIDLDKVLKGLDEGSAEYADVKKKYDAAEKAYNYIRENVHDMLQKTITRTQGYLDDTNVAVTDNGTRSQRLDLISNRLMDQKTTFQVLQSENEDIDIADVLIKLNSTNLTYNSALMATGKIMQTSLMNFI